MATYCVDGMVMWHLTLTGHHRVFNILFEGGHRTAFGETPATFTTNNEFLMLLIEESPYFKSGRIYTLDRPSPLTRACNKLIDTNLS